MIADVVYKSILRGQSINQSILRGEPEDQQHAAGVSGRTLPVDPRLRLLDQNEGGHPR